jgi:prepilin-type processing-associated H-X9-DG protein
MTWFSCDPTSGHAGWSPSTIYQWTRVNNWEASGFALLTDGIPYGVTDPASGAPARADFPPSVNIPTTPIYSVSFRHGVQARLLDVNRATNVLFLDGHCETLGYLDFIKHNLTRQNALNFSRLIGWSHPEVGH